MNFQIRNNNQKSLDIKFEDIFTNLQKVLEQTKKQKQNDYCLDIVSSIVIDNAITQPQIPSIMQESMIKIDFDLFVQLKKMIELKVFNQKANELAQQLIPYGQTNYNLWYVKKMCFLNQSTTFEHEIQFSEETLFQKVKNFQLWEHRRFLLEQKNDPLWFKKQYQLIDQILQTQPKNYHAWSQRVWILDQLKNYQQQFQFTQTQLNKDILNNSVWAYRAFIIKKMIETENDEQQKNNILEKEIKNCFALIILNPNNIAAWNYLRGWLPSIKLADIPSKNDHLTKITANEQITSLILQFTKQKLAEVNNQTIMKRRHSLAQQQIQLLTTLVTIFSQTQQNKQFAKNSSLLLAQKEKQKQNYWKWVALHL